MGASMGLAVYLGWSRLARGYGERLLTRRMKRGKEDPLRVDERRGQPSTPRPEGTLIWFHAASVGESLSIQELIQRLGSEDPTLSFLLTTGTRTSAELLATRLPPRTVHHYVPIDVHDFVEAFLDHWHPDLAIWTESEFWPALMNGTSRRRIPMLLMNARMSESSYDRWRWFPGFAKSLLRRFQHVHVQDQRSAARLMRLGLPRDRVTVTGSLKEGTAPLPCDETERDAVARALQSRPVWLASSTHEGEEQLVARAHRMAVRSAHRLLLIMVPRHPERGPQIAASLVRQGWDVALRSEGGEPGSDTQVYIADTLGELGLWYRVAPISFVGGSLVPIGGHNPFEPAALGSAIIHGPHVENFEEIFGRLREAGAARMVTSSETLGAAVRTLLSPEVAAKMAHAAWEISSSGAEVTDKAVALVFEALDQAA